jgi:Suppressor of fused protein (SUFU)
MTGERDIGDFFGDEPSGRKMASFECRYLEDITKHIKAHIGPCDFVHHEIISYTVHVDVHLVPPNDRVPYLTIVTSGMSDEMMPVPAKDRGEFGDGLAEMIAFLPPAWPYEKADDKRSDPKADLGWPEDLARSFAKGVHDSHSFYDWYHTTSNGTPPCSFVEDTDMSGFIFTPPKILPDAAWVVPTHDGKSIRLLNMVPILIDEINYGIKNGGSALFKKLKSSECEFVFDPYRKSCLASRNKLWGLF